MALNLIQRAKRVESLIERLPGVNRTEPEQYLCLESNYSYCINIHVLTFYRTGRGKCSSR